MCLFYVSMYVCLCILLTTDLPNRFLLLFQNIKESSFLFEYTIFLILPYPVIQVESFS